MSGNDSGMLGAVEGGLALVELGLSSSAVEAKSDLAGVLSALGVTTNSLVAVHGEGEARVHWSPEFGVRLARKLVVVEVLVADLGSWPTNWLLGARKGRAPGWQMYQTLLAGKPY